MELSTQPTKQKEKSKENTKKLTPLMEQYWSIKKNHQDRLLLFRMGDFYELFGQDAKTASEVLNITLTQRNKKSGDDTLMCGFPHHSMEAPVNKLLDAGFRLAVCDQLESPQEAKGLVKRGVTLMLSPGLVFNPSMLQQEESVYLAAFDEQDFCLFEPSTGQALAYHLHEQQNLEHLIWRHQPKEILILKPEDRKKISRYSGIIQEVSYANAREALLSYVEEMQGLQATFGFESWTEINGSLQVNLSAHFFKHMEVFSSNEGDQTKSLFQSIKRTKTPGGARLLRRWLENPLLHEETILKRQEGISFWKDDFLKLKRFRKELSEVGDMERRVARAGHPLGGPQDLVRLSRSLEAYLKAFSFEAHPEVQEIQKLLTQALEEEPVSQWQSKGGYIKKGFSQDLDELIDLSLGAQEEIQKLESQEKEKTGISTLKIRFNNVFGFYVEVTKTHKDKVPEHYVRKQTLTNSERYTTQELAILEEKVLSAKSKRLALEKEVFLELKESLRQKVLILKEACRQTNLQDVHSSLAFLCLEKNFSLPLFDTKEHSFKVKESFHPVVFDDLIRSEKQTFITNDFQIDQDKIFYLITGPNMAGKSTMMRQVVLISYLAQCGLPVPASEARLPLYDAFFTRVGASDVLSEGLSTFMLEMKETSEILEKATSRSLLILDEIGRGTSTADGCALAQGIVDHLLKHTQCHSLFATHYHNLTGIDFGPQVQNIHMGYYEKEGRIQFTYKVKEGPSQKSYGIEVARLAGLPEEVIQKAFDLVKKQEQDRGDLCVQSQLELPLFSQEDPGAQKLFEDLKKTDILNMTPLEALSKLSEWQENYL